MTERLWETALEAQMNAAKTVKDVLAAKPYHTTTAWWPMLRQTLPAAACFAWEGATTNALWTAVASIPDDALVTPSAALPEGLSACYWHFASPLPARSPDTLRSGLNAIEIDWDHLPGLLLVQVQHDVNGSPVGPGLGIMEMRATNSRRVLPRFPLMIPSGISLAKLNDRMMNYGEGAPGEPPEARVEYVAYGKMLARFVLGACAWLRQRIVHTSEHPIERHLRKRIMREAQIESLPTVKVVELRRLESSPHSPTDEPGSVDWSCRWVVGGHWRNQPYKDRHELIYILPYVKGPADKPLRLPTHTVYVVDR
jgi:hypothetical protein